MRRWGGDEVMSYELWIMSYELWVMSYELWVMNWWYEIRGAECFWEFENLKIWEWDDELGVIKWWGVRVKYKKPVKSSLAWLFGWA